MSKKPTLHEVAKLSGVSTAAVSRFLSGKLRPTEETAKRIRDAIRKTNYVPHASGRRLRFGRSEALGFVAPDLSNPFFALLASAVASSAWEVGLDLLVWNSEDIVERVVAAVRRLRSSYIDGLLIVTNHKSEKSLTEELRDAGPMVLLDEDVTGVTGSRVFVDNEHGGWLATKTLLDMGHSRIAHIGSPGNLMSAELRCRGWRKALAEAGIQVPDGYYVSGPINQKFGRSALETMMRLPTPPTAIFVGADAIAFGVIAASHEVGLRIPEDLSIISFDGLPVGALLDPPLSTVAQPIGEMGRKGVELLVRRIETPKAKLERVILPVTLEIRASAAPLRPKARAAGRTGKA
jgi:LacI family transcriptional regulator